MPDERYESIILQALPAEYERIRTASYERRDFYLADIRRMMSALYIDCLSCPNNSPLVTSRGVAMQVNGGDDSAIKCHYCGNPGHRQKNCVAWIAAQCKNGNRQTTRSTSLGRWKKKTGGDSKPMWCSFHKSTTHSDETCYNSNWATTVAQIVPTRVRTTMLSSLQAILLPVVILRSKAYRSLQ